MPFLRVSGHRLSSFRVAENWRLTSGDPCFQCCVKDDDEAQYAAQHLMGRRGTAPEGQKVTMLAMIPIFFS